MQPHNFNGLDEILVLHSIPLITEQSLQVPHPSRACFSTSTGIIFVGIELQGKANTSA